MVITDFFGHGQSLGVRDGGEFLLPQLLYGFFVIPQIQLGAHQDDGSVGTVMSHLRIPLRRHQQPVNDTAQTGASYGDTPRSKWTH